MDLRGFFKKINETAVFAGLAEFNEPMAGHTTFKTGGLADLWVKPEKSIFINWTAAMLKAAKAEGVPVFILGGGANLLVADKGIRGIVLDTGFWEEISGAAPENAVKRKEGCELTAESLKAESLTAEVLTVKVLSGTSIDGLARNLAAKGLSGMQSFAGMPGSVGGAVWMNARCYDKSISDVLVKVEILNENFEVAAAAINKNDFSYKQSPFQKRDVLILSAYFMVEPGETV
ncbi:MAG: FAD-binding protein, partial [Treponema sp.]|nr:FAD-binding protein [Treponema sp.]